MQAQWYADNSIWAQWRDVPLVNRPTEDEVFETLAGRNYYGYHARRRTHLTQTEWAVLQAERHALTKRRPLYEHTHTVSEIARQLHIPSYAILEYLEAIEAVCQYRLSLGMDPLPPQPRRMKAVWEIA